MRLPPRSNVPRSRALTVRKGTRAQGQMDALVQESTFSWVHGYGLSRLTIPRSSRYASACRYLGKQVPEALMSPCMTYIPVVQASRHRVDGDEGSRPGGHGCDVPFLGQAFSPTRLVLVCLGGQGHCRCPGAGGGEGVEAPFGRYGVVLVSPWLTWGIWEGRRPPSGAMSVVPRRRTSLINSVPACLPLKLRCPLVDNEGCFALGIFEMGRRGRDMESPQHTSQRGLIRLVAVSMCKHRGI